MPYASSNRKYIGSHSSLFFFIVFTLFCLHSVSSFSGVNGAGSAAFLGLGHLNQLGSDQLAQYCGESSSSKLASTGSPSSSHHSPVRGLVGPSSVATQGEQRKRRVTVLGALAQERAMQSGKLGTPSYHPSVSGVDSSDKKSNGDTAEKFSEEEEIIINILASSSTDYFDNR